MSHYIQEILNLRHAIRVISGYLPEIIDIGERKAITESDMDLCLAFMSDMEFKIICKKYEKIPEPFLKFCPDEYIETSNTIWPEDIKEKIKC